MYCMHVCVVARGMQRPFSSFGHKCSEQQEDWHVHQGLLYLHHLCACIVHGMHASQVSEGIDFSDKAGRGVVITGEIGFNPNGI